MAPLVCSHIPRPHQAFRCLLFFVLQVTESWMGPGNEASWSVLTVIRHRPDEILPPIFYFFFFSLCISLVSLSVKWHHTQGFIQDFEMGGGKQDSSMTIATYEMCRCLLGGGLGACPPPLRKIFEFTSSQIASDTIWDKTSMMIHTYVQ